MFSFDKEFSRIEEEYYSRPKHGLFDRLSKDDAEVVIFGAGAVGYSVADTVPMIKERLAAFCDNYKSGRSELFNVPVISPERLMKDYGGAVIIVAAGHPVNDEIYNQLISAGFCRDNIFRFYSGYELYDIDRMKTMYEGYKWAYSFFKEDIEKQIVLDRIRMYLFVCETEHSPQGEQYFEAGAIRFTDREIFVDGGCYIGDTSLEFIKRVNGEYAHIFGFEPEAENYGKAQINLAAYKNVELTCKGLWDKDAVFSVTHAGGSSKIGGAGAQEVAVTSLDGFFAGKQENCLPTFIKLDIEGAEKCAIMGARDVIARARPKLAVCVYHRPEDIYELPRVIMGMNRYRFALRHYSAGSVETVLYAT